MLKKDLMISIMVKNLLKKSREIKLDEAKKQQNKLISNLNKISRGRFKSEE